MTYLSLLAVVLTPFGWGLLFLCCLSSTLREMIFGTWTQRDGYSLFQACCWSLHSTFDLLTRPIYGGISFVFGRLSASVGISTETIRMILLTIPIGYLFVITWCQVRGLLDSVLLSCELRVEVVAVIVVCVVLLLRSEPRDGEVEEP